MIPYRNKKYGFGTDTLICPYCGREQYNHEPDEIDAYMATDECEECGKLIEYSVKVERTYYSFRDENENEYDNSANEEENE